MTPIADLFAGLKQSHARGCPPVLVVVEGPVVQYGGCRCGAVIQHAAVDAVAAEIARRDEEQRAVIAAMGTALRDGVTLRIGSDDPRAPDGCGFQCNKCDAYSPTELTHAPNCAIGALLVSDAVAHAIEEHRAMVAVVEAAEQAIDGDALWPLVKPVAAYRAARGTR